jgi:hypothetical protein
MARFGSDANSYSQSTFGIFDEAGNRVVDTSVRYSSSPLGVAARSQALYGIANAQFNLTPPAVDSVLEDNENPLPYWSVTNLSDGRLTAYSVFDTTTGTWGVELNPSAGSASDSIMLTTRSYLLNDDSLALRQRAYLTLGKTGTAAGTTQWNAVMTAEYFDTNGASLSGGTAYAIGTALDTATFTTINGVTTSGSAAISASAAYVDIDITLTCTANVTGSAKATLKSMLLQTSSGGSSKSFLIAERYTASTTWTRPTGVDYVSVWAVGGGAGGGSGTAATHPQSNAGTATRGEGGGGGAINYIKGLYIGDQTTISVGVGTGGAGGGAAIYTKPVAQAAGGTAAGSAGANGGNTTFGTYLTAQGGQGATGGTATLGIYGDSTSTSGATVGGTASTDSPTNGYLLPYHSTYAAAGQGSGTATSTGTGTASATPVSAGGAGSAVSAGGGSGASANSLGTAFSNGGVGGAGGGGPRIIFAITATGTATANAGGGGNASANSGSGGGGGGASLIRFGGTATATNFTNSRLISTSGAGGNGGDGYVIIVYTA